MHLGSNIQEDVRVTPNVTVPHAGGSNSPPELRATAAVMCSQSVSRHTALWELVETQQNRFRSNTQQHPAQHKAQYSNRNAV